MAKSIDTLVEDIYALFGSGHDIDESRATDLGLAMIGHIRKALAKRENGDGLRASNVGDKCDRKSHYRVHAPEEAEEPEPWTKFKFLYGHLIEEVVLFLVEEAGHSVVKRQGEIDIYGVKGHTDGIIDGCTVDVKSANSRGMDKFKYHLLEKEDPFGYLTQVNIYHEGNKDDAALENKDEVSFLAVDKELGHIVLDRYRARSSQDVRAAVASKLVAVADPDRVPDRGFSPEPDGKSGNMALPLNCRYCEFKKKCHPSMRTFLYSSGPKYLTTVERLPDVPEVK